MFFGGSGYLGGNIPSGVFGNYTALNGLAGGLRFGGGMYSHPSFSMNRGVNYFAGTVAGGALPIQDTYAPVMTPNNVQGLQSYLNAARDEQGVLGKFWDGLKNITGIGLGSNKCQQYIDKAALGQMSIQDAYSKISKYTVKQKGGVNLMSGIAAATLSIAAIGTAPITSGASLLAAAGMGAGIKAGLKTLDRATNNVDNDALDTKKIVKDGLSGALNALTSKFVLLKNAGHVFTAASAKEALKQGAVQGAKCGAISGALMSAGDYAIECGLEPGQKFNGDDFITTTIYGSIAGGLTGGITGGIATRNAYIKCFGPQAGGSTGGYNGPQGPNGGGNPSGGNGGGYYQPQGLPNGSTQTYQTSSQSGYNSPSGSTSTPPTSGAMPIGASTFGANNNSNGTNSLQVPPFVQPNGSNNVIQLSGELGSSAASGSSRITPSLTSQSNGSQLPSVIQLGTSSTSGAENIISPPVFSNGSSTPLLPENTQAGLSQIAGSSSIEPSGLPALKTNETLLLPPVSNGGSGAIDAAQPVIQPSVLPKGPANPPAVIELSGGALSDGGILTNPSGLNPDVAAPLRPQINQSVTGNNAPQPANGGAQMPSGTQETLAGAKPDTFIQNLTSFLKNKLKH